MKLRARSPFQVQICPELCLASVNPFCSVFFCKGLIWDGKGDRERAMATVSW